MIEKNGYYKMIARITLGGSIALDWSFEEMGEKNAAAAAVVSKSASEIISSI